MVTETNLDTQHDEMSNIIKYYIYLLSEGTVKTMNTWLHMAKMSWNYYLAYPLQKKGNITLLLLLDKTPNLTFVLQQILNKTHLSPRFHWSLSPCVQSCTICRPSSVPAGQTQTSVRLAPWRCTGNSDPASEAGEGGAAGVQSWAGEPRRSEEERQVWRT